MSRPTEIPWSEIDSLFLDAGNTLVSIDFSRVSAELSELGVACEARVLERAEAAARPLFSAALAERGSTEGRGGFERYLHAMLGALPQLDDGRSRELADRLAPRLSGPGLAHRLWCRVLPGVPESLDRFARAGLQLVVVSNSDGSVERGLADVGLRPHFDFVVDSHHVGFEKPDRRIFEHALSVSGSDPTRTLHVGDLVYADVDGARNAGLHALLLDPYDDWRNADCPRLPDLRALADRIAAARSGASP